MQATVPLNKQVSFKRYGLLAMLICLVVRLVINAFIPSLQIMPDEYGAIANGAILAGQNWRDTLGSYFGMGFAFLYVPLFWWVKDVSVQYYCIQAVCAVLQSIPAYLCYRLMRLYGVKNQWYCFGISVALSFLTAARANTANNESAMILTTWLIVYFLCHATHPNVSKKNKNICTLLAGLSVGIAQLAHTRALVYVAGIVVVVLYYFIFQRKWIVNPYIFGASLLVCFLGFSLIVGSIQKNYYPVADAETTTVLKNSTASFGGQLWELLSKLRPRNIKTFFTFLLTNLYILSTYSGLTIALGGIWGIYLVFKQSLIPFFSPLRGEKETSPLSNWQTRASKTFLSKYSEMMPAILFCLFCLITTLVAHCLTWMPMYPTEAYYPIYIQRGYFYLRYFFSYGVPLVMFFAVFLTQQDRETNTLFKVTLAVFLAIRTAVYFLFLPAAEQLNSVVLDSLHYMAPFCFNSFGEAISSTSFFLVTGFALLCFALIWLAYRKRRLALFAVVLCLYGMYQYTYTAINFDRVDANIYYSKINASVDALPNIIDPGSTVYTKFADYNDKINLQYWLQDYKIESGTPPASAESALLVSSNGNLKRWAIEGGYYYICLDRNEYLYIKGEALLQQAKSLGYELVPSYTTHFWLDELYLSNEEEMEDNPEQTLREDGRLAILPGNIQYGPYTDLPAGNYTVTITGENLDLAQFAVTGKTGAHDFPFDIETLTPSKCVYNFTIEEELVAEYQQELLAEKMQADPTYKENGQDSTVYPTYPDVEFLIINGNPSGSVEVHGVTAVFLPPEQA